MKTANSVWSDGHDTKIVLKSKKILQFKHIKRKDEKNINEVQIGVYYCIRDIKGSDQW